MAHLELLVGMIACGKSTYAKRKASEEAIILNDDSIITALHGGKYDLYKEDNKPLYKAIGYNIITHALTHNQHVVVDRPNLKRSTRIRYASIANTMDIPVSYTIFPIEQPEVHGKRRAKSDNRGISEEKWIEVAKKHYENAESVNREEAFLTRTVNYINPFNVTVDNENTFYLDFI